MISKSITIGIACVSLLFAPVTAAECHPVKYQVLVQVCTYYHATGQTSCAYHYEWEQGWECTVWGSGPPPPPPPDGGGLVPDPPHCEILGISDENIDQMILSVQANESVVEMTVAIDGDVVATANGRTDQFMLQGVGLFAGGETPVSVSCRSANGLYSTPVAVVTRAAAFGAANDRVYGVWTVISPDDEPEQVHGEWSRTVDLLATHTTYDVPTFGARNGEWEHTEVEDRLDEVGTTPIPAWEAKYVIDNPQLLNVYWGSPCPYAWISRSICTSVNAFSRAGSPWGTAIITNLDVPFQSSIVSILIGEEVNVAPEP